MGAVVGRVANRIADAKFVLDGQEYTLAKNNGPNALHGGIVGIDKVNWRSSVNQDEGTVTFSHISKDGDEGYPGDVLYNVRYSLDSEGGVKIQFSAMVSAPTPINLANHVYFNLAGQNSGASGLNDHVMRMAANHYTPVSDKLIPTGEVASVAGTVFDLRSPTVLGSVLPKCPGGDNNGFDHNFVLANTEGDLNFVCRVDHPDSGRWLECYTDQPGVQFYTGNFIPVDTSLTHLLGLTRFRHILTIFCVRPECFGPGFRLLLRCGLESVDDAPCAARSQTDVRSSPLLLKVEQIHGAKRIHATLVVFLAPPPPKETLAELSVTRTPEGEPVGLLTSKEISKLRRRHCEPRGSELCLQ